MQEPILWLVLFASMMGVVLLEYKWIAKWKRKALVSQSLFHNEREVCVQSESS